MASMVRTTVPIFLTDIFHNFERYTSTLNGTQWKVLDGFKMYPRRLLGP